MATLFTDIYELFLVEVTDWKIDRLYALSVPQFETYLQGFLVRAVPKFTNCEQSLVYSLTTDSFTSDFTVKEKSILTNLMTIEWFNKEIHNISQFNNLLSDQDMKFFSPAQNLREKSEYKDRLRETVSQDMVDYGISNISWSDWADGEYGI